MSVLVACARWASKGISSSAGGAGFDQSRLRRLRMQFANFTRSQREVLAMCGKVHSNTEVTDGGAKMKTKASRIGFLAMVSLATLCLSLCGGTAAAQDEPDNGNNQRSTAEDFLRLRVRPIAIGHHGVGPNSRSEER